MPSKNKKIQKRDFAITWCYCLSRRKFFNSVYLIHSQHNGNFSIQLAKMCWFFLLVVCLFVCLLWDSLNPLFQSLSDSGSILQLCEREVFLPWYIKCWYTPCYDSWSSERDPRSHVGENSSVMTSSCSFQGEGRGRMETWSHVHSLLLPGATSPTVMMVGSEYFLVVINQYDLN